MPVRNLRIAVWQIGATCLSDWTHRNRSSLLWAVVNDSELELSAGAGADDILLFVAPEYLYSEHGTVYKPLSREVKHDVYATLAALSARFPRLVIVAGTIYYFKEKGWFTSDKHAYNVAPVLHGGRIIHKLYKLYDDANARQVNHRFKTKTEALKSNPRFEHAGLRWGLDICLDYLNLRALNSNNAHRLDVHIQISGSNFPDPERVSLAPNGVYIHSNFGKDYGNSKHVFKQQQLASPDWRDSLIEPIRTNMIYGSSANKVLFFHTDVGVD